MLAWAALLRSDLWNRQGPATIASWGLVAPLLQWAVGKELRTMRGFPAVEAMLVTCVNVFNSALPMGGVIAQHALFLSVASMELWARSPRTGSIATATNLMVTATNFFLGVSACCLLCLAHNREASHSFLASSPAAPPPPTAAAAGAAANSLGPKTATADTGPYACAQSTPGSQAVAKTQEATGMHVAAAQEGEVTNAAEKEPSSRSIPFVSFAFSASQPSPSVEPSAHPGAFGWTPALAKTLFLNASLIAWVQKAELWLLAVVPQEEAKLFASLASATFVGTRFLASVANYSVPGIVAMSPTMDMLAIVLGMLMGGTPDMQGWAVAQIRAYR
ncbi:hypothetical protein DUNSADRAFT_13334 [Dunaliella salina]|uniref:Uncharacterized protein n=1 Tax=Dunaliella salina TaxID=3046 RepID=A0ABQ7G9J3_DUNSA|nr:hypothetical protein DUNSADRAFT_13334 [Dunaliella salina]|eukprot:KAF5831278.1 hypothetical protein DUNSADRAFT_13334 [Dunaliella salina]